MTFQVKIPHSLACELLLLLIQDFLYESFTLQRLIQLTRTISIKKPVQSLTRQCILPVPCIRFRYREADSTVSQCIYISDIKIVIVHSIILSESLHLSALHGYHHRGPITADIPIHILQQRIQDEIVTQFLVITQVAIKRIENIWSEQTVCACIICPQVFVISPGPSAFGILKQRESIKDCLFIVSSIQLQLGPERHDC